jgi:hypothetical protein
MAIRATLNPFESLSYEESTALENLLEKPLIDFYADEEGQGWSIRVDPHAFFDHPYPKPKLETGFAALSNKTYSLITIKQPHKASETAESDAQAQEGDTEDEESTGRVNEGGNFCGHNPEEPRFVMAHHAYFCKQEIDDLGDKRRPQILYDIVERLKAYYYDPEIIPMLQVANADKRLSDNKRRSELREASVSLLSVMIMNMDLGSLRIGQPRLKAASLITD